MDDRRRFSILQLVVLLAIIAILAGVILLFTGRARHSSEVELQRADFQVIAAALEAYKHDFGDYPRNINLPVWNTEQNGPTPAPVFYSLAPALLGPGPAVTEPVNGILEVGDGSDGPGFRCEFAAPISGSTSVTAGQSAATINLDPTDRSEAQKFAANLPHPAMLTLAPTPTQPYPEAIAITGATISGERLHLTLAAGLAYPHDGKCTITVPLGKVWGPYIQPERFKVSYIPSVDSYGASFFGYGQPVLLDRWNQVIEYFPRYRAEKDVGKESGPPRPLYGFCQPKSIDPAHGAAAIFDWRDGAPFFTIVGQTGPAQSWPNPTMGTGNSFRPELAIQWMLEPGFDGDYFLISVGPGGLERSNGGFCNFADPANGNNPYPASSLEQVFSSSGNIYSFDRR